LPDQHDVCSVDDLEPGRPLLVRVEGLEVVVVRVADEVFALRNVCPHQGASLAQGYVRPRYSSASADSLSVEVDRSQPVLVCPWHTWTFSLRDGRCLTDPRSRVRSYAATVEDGRVLLGTRRRPQGGS
jgi:3-phenylpropionate/trans-cinnamate dioxygenase ferredoxin subunit